VARPACTQAAKPPIFRIADGQIAEAWFFPDGFDPEALSEVFSFAASA
jgi:hypothetical protein